MKNDFFNLKRFGTYFSSDLLNCYRNFGLNMLILSLLGVIAYFFTFLFHLLIQGTFSGGEPLGMRVFTFGLALMILLITYPKKCYGQVTDRKRGTNFILIPVSLCEKVLSMVLSCCVVAPAVFLVIFLGADALVCTVDSNCGTSLLALADNGLQELSQISGDVSIDMKPKFDVDIVRLFNPFLYFDDLMFIPLFFLLGALIFKSGKVAKTLGVLILGSMLLGMVISPVMIHLMGNAGEDIMSPSFVARILDNAVWIDCVTDTLVNLALLTGIYFRLKTIKL